MGEQTYEFGIRHAPLSMGVRLDILADTVHKKLSFFCADREVLLFDQMLVDAMFHSSNDPLTPYYPDEKGVRDQLTGSSVALRYLNEVLDAINGLQDPLEEGIRQVLHSLTENGVVLGQYLTPRVAEGYRKITFATQIPNMQEAADYLKKQVAFLGELPSEVRGTSLDQYKALQASVAIGLDRLRQVSELYDQLVAQTYGKQQPPFEKFGEEPSLSDRPVMGGLRIMQIFQRPAMRYYIGNRAKQAGAELMQALREVSSHSSRNGAYSTRPDLR